MTTQKMPEKISFMEKLVFGNRPLFLVIFGVVTALLFWQMIQLRPEASFEKMIPTYHPYVENYDKHKQDLKGLGNTVRIAVENTEGTIFDYDYMMALQKIQDEVFFISGVDRAGLYSLWSPNAKWQEVTEEGFDGGSIVPDTFDGSPESLEVLRSNVLKSGKVGQFVSNDFKSSIILVPLQDIDPETGKALDYQKFSQELERLVRDKYQSDSIQIHITGFAKIVGDLIDGSTRVFMFFLIAFVILLILLQVNSGCWRSTMVRAVSSLVAVFLQMGLLYTLGYGLNPYSMLVPFLMFALGVSHGIQMFNTMAHEILYGADKLTAAKNAYRLVYIPGLAALFTDCVGFLSLFVIAIGVIQDIAVGASIGVVVVALTDLMLLPVLMSYSGISKKTIDRLRKSEDSRRKHPLWGFLANLTNTRVAVAAVVVAVVALCLAQYTRQDLKIGDLDAGAPELRPDSRYNLDNAFMNDNFSTSSDLFVVMVESPEDKAHNYTNLVAMDRLEWQLRQLKGVQSIDSLSNATKQVLAGFNEGNFKHMSLIRNDDALLNSMTYVPFGMVNRKESLALMKIYLNDHKAETLESVVRVVDAFAAENNTENATFLMAAGNAGIEAATNIEVEKAHLMMTILVYAIVFVVCIGTFRSVRAALCVVLPLYLTSVLCEALMTKLGIGIKVATLPVIAVGVGIGVDYGIYIFNKLKYYLQEGYNLEMAYYHTLNTTGRAVSFTGITLSIGVATWAFSPIKFQADMGILLTFMFLVNMLGALLLLPALAKLFGISSIITKKEPGTVEPEATLHAVPAGDES